MPGPTFPSIGAVFRQLEKLAINSSSTFERDPRVVYKDEEVLPAHALLGSNWRMTSEDRTLFVPNHTGRNILPCHPLFDRLVRFANADPPRLCVRDVNTGVEATHVQLLSDVLSFRERVWEGLSAEARKALDQREEIYIAILAPGGYEFTVAILAALALGAAVVPMTVVLPPQEALYFVTKSRASAILVSNEALRLGLSLEKLVKDQDPHSPFVCIPVSPSLKTSPLNPSEIIVSSDLFLDDNSPGVVIFTSGTTGRPKGAVMRRAFIFNEALGIVDHYGIASSDTLIHCLPVHHATGIGINFFPFLVAGGLLEFRSGSFSPEWTWERWRKGSNLVFSAVPTIYTRMMRYFQQNLASRSDVQDYIDGARGLKVALCGTSALPKPIADFWAQLLGRHILLRYGMTETGAVLRVRAGDHNVPDGSVGMLSPGCDVRLSEGDEGEILAKSSGMFSKFLFDPEATANSHTDGYYKTGDIARREGHYYWIMGRASVDIIKSGGYKISALDIEREILALPYIAEVMIVGVPDDEYGERVGAVVCLNNEKDMTPSERGQVVHNLTIQKLREDLRTRLASYKMPTVLRVIPEELPKSGTGKIVKKSLGPQFFPPENYKHHAEVQVWSRKESEPKTKL